MFRILLCVVTLLSGAAWAQSQLPYVGQQFREIKALSPQEISDYLSGKGMGLAKAAELNGYLVPRMSSNSPHTASSHGRPESQNRSLV
jgi:hypothetical protein